MDNPHPFVGYDPQDPPRKLRDEFAMAALPALMAALPSGDMWAVCAEEAYALADVMLEARKR